MSELHLAISVWELTIKTIKSFFNRINVTREKSEHQVCMFLQQAPREHRDICWT